jgi:hypothetical protein
MSNNDDGQETAEQPGVDLAQNSSRTGTRVIQPTGESITPKVDMDNLIANEEAKDIMSQPALSDSQPQTANAPAAASVTPAPEIQVDAAGAINVNNLPSTPNQDSATFPNQS